MSGWVDCPTTPLESCDTSYQVKLCESLLMDTMRISTKGQIVLPVAIRRALGLKPGMRVLVQLEGKRALITPAPSGQPTRLKDIQALLAYNGPPVAVDDMQVTDYEG